MTAKSQTSRRRAAQISVSSLAMTAQMAALEHMSEAFYAVDAEWQVIAFNAAAERHFGLSRSKVIGRILWDVLPMRAGTWFEAWLEAVIDTGQPNLFEMPSVVRPDRLVEGKAFPLDLGAAGTGVGMLIRDRTLERQTETSLAAQNVIRRGKVTPVAG